MNYKELKEKLKDHKESTAKRDLLRAQYQALTEYTNNFTKIKMDSGEEAILGMTFNSPAGERVSTSGTSDKTANIALNYHKDKEEHQKSFKEAEERKKDLYPKVQRYERKVVEVETFLRALTQKEKFIVEQFYMENLFLKGLEIAFNQQFSRPENYITHDTLRKIKYAAMQKMLNVAKVL